MIKTLSHKISVTERTVVFSKKKSLSKQCQKEVIYEYILALTVWWFNLQMVVRGGVYISASGGWWWVVVGGGGQSHSLV